MNEEVVAMDPHATRLTRAPILARARFIEDLVVEQVGHGVSQYVILGAGLDTFAQRRPEIASGLQVFEVDQPGPQTWKGQRLIELGFGIPEWLRLVPVDFEEGQSWWERLATAGFNAGQPAVVTSTGVTAAGAAVFRDKRSHSCHWACGRLARTLQLTRPSLRSGPRSRTPVVRLHMESRVSMRLTQGDNHVV